MAFWHCAYYKINKAENTMMYFKFLM